MKLLIKQFSSSSCYLDCDLIVSYDMYSSMSLYGAITQETMIWISTSILFYYYFLSPNYKSMLGTSTEEQTLWKLEPHRKESVINRAKAYRHR
jgi:hypothetical protein